MTLFNIHFWVTDSLFYLCPCWGKPWWVWVCHFSGWKGVWRTEFLPSSSCTLSMGKSQQDPFLWFYGSLAQEPYEISCRNLGVIVTGGSSFYSSIYDRHISQTNTQTDLFSFHWFSKSWSKSMMRWSWLKFPYLKKQCFEVLWTLSSQIQLLLPRKHSDISCMPDHVPSHRESVGVSPYFHGEHFYWLTHRISGRPNLVVTVFFWEA